MNHFMSKTILVSFVFLLGSNSIYTQDSCDIEINPINFPFNKISIEKYSPYLIEMYTESIVVNINRKPIRIKCTKPEIVRIHNSDILIFPNQTTVIDSFSNSLLHEAFAGKFNNTLLTFQTEIDKLNRLFTSMYKDSFSTKKYLSQVDSAFAKWQIILFKDRNSIKEFPSFKIELENYFLSKMLFFYSRPYLAENILQEEKNKLDDVYFTKLKTYNEDNTLFPSLLPSVNWFYVKELFSKYKSLAEIQKSKYWDVSKKLQKIIATELIKAYARNQLKLSKDEIQSINFVLCGEIKRSMEDKYCEYFISKKDFNNLIINEFAAEDSIIDSNHKTTSLSDFSKGKNLHLYMWRSTCYPCVHYMETIDMEKLAQADPVSIIFLSLDSDFDVWKNRNDVVKLPLQNSYMIKNGYNSAFAKRLQLRAIPALIDLNKGKVNMFNLSKNIFFNYLKN